MVHSLMSRRGQKQAQLFSNPPTSYPRLTSMPFVVRYGNEVGGFFYYNKKSSDVTSEDFLLILLPSKQRAQRA